MGLGVKAHVDHVVLHQLARDADRRGDTAYLVRWHLRDGEVTIRTEKIGMVTIAPALAPLAASIATTPIEERTVIAAEWC